MLVWIFFIIVVTLLCVCIFLLSVISVDLRELKTMLDYRANQDPHGIPMVISDIQMAISTKETDDKISTDYIYKTLDDINSSIGFIMEYIATKNPTPPEEEDEDD